MNIDGDGLASAFSDIIDEAEDDDKLEDYLNNHIVGRKPVQRQQGLLRILSTTLSIQLKTVLMSLKIPTSTYSLSST